MYRELSKKEWLKLLLLPEDFRVDGALVAGAGVAEKEIEKRDFVIKSMNLNVEIEKINHRFFDSVDILVIDGKRYWFDVVYGGAYLSETLGFASMFGSKRNIFIGSCGGLSMDMKSGDIVIPTYSYGDESTTRMYQRDVENNKHYSNEKLNKEIKDLIPDKYRIHSGPIMTCQAMLAETKEDVSGWSKEGYTGVEMETSTFFAVSNYYDIPSSAILHVSDNLLHEEYVGSEQHEKARPFRDEVQIEKYKVAFKVLMN